MVYALATASRAMMAMTYRWGIMNTENGEAKLITQGNKDLVEIKSILVFYVTSRIAL